MKIKNLFLFVFSLFLLFSCVTVNIYFPAAAVQRAADAIVEDVRGLEKNFEKIKEKKSDKESNIRKDLRVSSIAFVSTAYAQLDIEVSTPAIRALKESLKQRFVSLKQYYEIGAIGENNKGLLEIRDTSSLTLKQKAELNRLIEQENRDRNNLYEEIARANKFGKEMVPEIQRIFANSWREKSLPNWWIQKDEGIWIRK
ncbi:MAG: YdbL family protein [Thermodesulfovibrionales bacterium]|nr:YdbL family protein [Thermodesulfovibrionales bacterium]